MFRIFNMLGVILLITAVSAPAAAAPPRQAPNNMHEFMGVIKGAVPGFAKKPRYFNASLAEKNLRFLYDEKDVRLVISLDHCKGVGKVIRKMNKSLEVPIEHICRKIHRTTYEKNITLFEEIASHIGAGNFYIHCRYGAHRAVTALTGAWIARQRLSFEEAFSRTGGKKRAFRSKGQKQLLNQARKYAADRIE